MTPPASISAAPNDPPGASSSTSAEKSTARQRPVLVDSLLVLALVVSSVAAGWFLGRTDIDEVVIIEANYTADSNAAAFSTDSQDVGRMKAEFLRLRVLFQRLAEIAEIDHDGEFDVDFEIDALTGDGEPLAWLDTRSPDAMALLFSRLDPMIRQVESMESIFVERRREYDLRLSGRPLQSGQVSSGFGQRVDPLSGTTVMHHGLDFVADVGEPILALGDGIVTWSGANGGYGLLVELEHADGFKTRYAHNDATLVDLGSRVRKGEAIATLGSSGRSTGPHLHLEVRHRGKATDPRYFVR